MKLLTTHCKAAKWDMACKDIVQRNEDRKASRLLHKLSGGGGIPKQIVRRQPFKIDYAHVTYSRKKASKLNIHVASTVQHTAI